MKFTSKRAYLLLSLNLNQQREAPFDHFALGRCPTETHREGDQTFVDYDIGPHPCLTDLLVPEFIPPLERFVVPRRNPRNTETTAEEEGLLARKEQDHDDPHQHHAVCQK